MSSLECVCGHVIRDTTENLPYKASFLLNRLDDAFWDWIAEELEQYDLSIQEGRAMAWLASRGFSPEPGAGVFYFGLGDYLQVHMLTRYVDLSRDMYECEKCGRIHVETAERNRFVSYVPDAGRALGVFAS